MSRIAGVAVLAAAMGWPCAAAMAQAVRLEAPRAVEPEVRARVQSVLSGGRYEVWTRDTLLAAGHTVQGDVVILRATARVSGVVTGTILGVESEVFIRPGAEVRGGLVVLNGGYYGTQMATIGPVLHRPIADYRVRPVSDDPAAGYRIVPPEVDFGFELLGVSGLLLPTYERVSALTVSWGVRYRPGASAWVPEAWGVVRYRTARRRADGEVHLRWAGGRIAVEVEGGRTTATQDAWISGDLENSLSSFGFAADHRDYYDAKFARIGAEVRHGTVARLRHGLRLEWEQAQSLGSEDPFSIFDAEGGFRPNPPLGGGRLAGLRIESELETGLGRSALRLAAFWELADREIAGDATYARAGGELAWQAPTFRGHALRVRARADGPLAGSVPSQRWTGLGGNGTLPTLDHLSLRGDTHLFVQSTYFVSALSTGLGEIRLWVQHAVGSAWSGPRPPLEQNLGLGADLGPFALWVFGDPAESDGDLEVGFGLSEF